MQLVGVKRDNFETWEINPHPNYVLGFMIEKRINMFYYMLSKVGTGLGLGSGSGKNTLSCAVKKASNKCTVNFVHFTICSNHFLCTAF